MKITLSTDNGHIFTTVRDWNTANEAAKAIFKRKYWSDLYYDITFDDATQTAGSIDLEPQSFHKPHQENLFTWHLKTFWGNVSKETPKVYLSQEYINECKNLLNYLP